MARHVSAETREAGSSILEARPDMRRPPLTALAHSAAHSPPRPIPPPHPASSSRRRPGPPSHLRPSRGRPTAPHGK